MGIPTTYLSLHDVTGLRAAALQSFDTPLVLSVETPHGSMQISFYLREASAAKIEALADTINAVMKAPEPPKVTCPVEKAAYAAQEKYWRDLKRDLDRDQIETIKIVDAQLNALDRMHGIL